MVDAIALGFVAAGLVVLFAGAVLSVYGIALLGALVGGASGWLLTAQLGLSAPPQVAGVVGVGALAGIAITYLLLTIAIGVMGFAVGTYVGAVGSQALLEDPQLLLVAASAIAVGAIAAFLGTVFKRTLMVFVTSFVGAALASRSVEPADFDAFELSNPDRILFDPGEPVFLALFALGVFTQLGLFKFGYVTALVAKLPGAGVLEDREGQTSEG